MSAKDISISSIDDDIRRLQIQATNACSLTERQQIQSRISSLLAQQVADLEQQQARQLKNSPVPQLVRIGDERPTSDSLDEKQEQPPSPKDSSSISDSRSGSESKLRLSPNSDQIFKRISRELRDFLSGGTINAYPWLQQFEFESKKAGSNYLRVKIKLKGPENSRYSKFIHLVLDCSKGYPAEPPQIIFRDIKVPHPDFDKGSSQYMKFLRHDWSSDNTLCFCLARIREVLAQPLNLPVANDPLDPIPKISWDDLDKGNYIYEGSFGKVYQAKWEGRDVAIKRLRLKQREFEAALNVLRQEAEILFKCSDANVVSLLGVCIEPGKYALVMEFMPFDLGELLRSDYDLPYSLRWKIASDIASGLCFIHSKGTIHRDLKPSNILVDKENRCKICDFGISRLQSGSFSSSEKRQIGTVRYRGPETFDRRFKPRRSMDIFSFGMVMWEISSRVEPFDDREDLLVQKWIVENKTLVYEPIPTSCPIKFSEIIQDCWRSPELRPLAAALKERISQCRQSHVDGPQPETPKQLVPPHKWRPRSLSSGSHPGSPGQRINTGDFKFDKIPWRELRQGELIEAGCFGKVYEGKWKTKVAIKKLLLSAHKLTPNLRQELFAEGERLTSFRDSPNIISLLGICLDQRTPINYIIDEFLKKAKTSHSSLNMHLKGHSPISYTAQTKSFLLVGI